MRMVAPLRTEPARLRHVPQMTSILWRSNRCADWLPAVRTRRTDLRLMTKVTRSGWVRMVKGPHGPAAFIARDGSRIHALYVHPGAQRRGLGAALLDDAKQHADRLDLWVAEANTQARAFYAAQGFAEDQRGIGGGNDENLPDILMVWRPETRIAR